MPQEALADEALLRAYVMKKRLEYAREKERAAGLKSANASIANHFIETFLADIAVDKKLITEPLTPQQTKAANAWKVTYLQRLCREKIDRSYIDAYLKAWGLRPEHVLQGVN